MLAVLGIPVIYRFTFFLLSPVLFLQGKYVRWVTPKLSEPVGDRSGQRGSGQDLSVLIVGDSAAAGVGVEHQRQGLSGKLIANLSVQHLVRWRVFAHSGDTSEQLLKKLQALPSEAYHVAIVSIGVNDVTGLTRSSDWQRNIRSIVEVLSRRHGVQQVYLSSIPPMHLFPALPNPLRWWLGLRARQFNLLMRNVAEDESTALYAEIPYSGEVSEIAADGFHPGEAAYAVWGDFVASLVQRGGTDK